MVTIAPRINTPNFHNCTPTIKKIAPAEKSNINAVPRSGCVITKKAGNKTINSGGIIPRILSMLCREDE